MPEDPQTNHSNADTAINGVDCDGNYAIAASTDGSAVVVYATMEGANGNYAQFSGYDQISGGLAQVQGLTAGTAIFGAVAR